MSTNRGRGRAASAAYHHQQMAEPPVRGTGRGAYGRGVDVQQHQQEATPSPSLRGARGGRGVGEHQPLATSVATIPLSAVNPSVVEPTPPARGHQLSVVSPIHARGYHQSVVSPTPARGQHPPVVDTTSVARGHHASVVATTPAARGQHPPVVDTTSAARGQRPPMSRYGAYASFTRQREQLEQNVGPSEKDEQQQPLLAQVVLRMEEHKKAEEESTDGQIQEVMVTPAQHEAIQHEQGGGDDSVVGAISHESRCRTCLFRAEFVHLMRSIGLLLTGFGNAIGGAHNHEQNHHGNAIGNGHNNEQNHH
ncbi:hypothetical protein GPALN_006465 [Globodera pallida]|nr:hypothetical protein GPALN_006465 [Globodera pallida]